MIYEEFFAIAQRNTIGKSKSHELFSKLYFKLMEHCFHEGYVIQMSNACPQTGWPIDISLQHRGLLSKLFVKSTTEDDLTDKDEPKKNKKDKTLDPKKLHNDGLG